MAATSAPTTSTSTPTQAFGRPPSIPYFIQSLDRGSFEAYLRSRANAFLQRQYKQLLQVPEGEEFPAYVTPYKRARDVGEEEAAVAAGEAGGSNASKRAKHDPLQPELPHIDSTFLLELTTAKPEAGVLAVGDAPDDVYLPALPKGKRDDHRALIGALIDRTIESDTLFWDLRRLNHAQVKALAETEWSRQIPVNPTTAAAAAAKEAAPTGTRSSRRQQQQMVSEEEREIDEEIASIRRAFCDKTRAQALATRAAAGW